MISTNGSARGRRLTVCLRHAGKGRIEVAVRDALLPRRQHGWRANSVRPPALAYGFFMDPSANAGCAVRSIAQLARILLACFFGLVTELMSRRLFASLFVGSCAK